ncbi:NAD-dependent succinate-semialdehyde dehydrogenase [Aquamicrobium sp. LC103]|uniref:NAD-dependent succinate-semialdehyde dehydrogenase n=1 Tax=Aquamicrobium sp. LC103 TaxID=1120658 RepID=UPI00063E72AC|nr:NAD-dependent succinate-semialdehyde dehydrogenase [Aquamicrobium sp. LC103]TKT74578.1 NAD-dependent succinate-semialdehyde dehydrogenase [Aquamicrobium sp. LC103]
MFEGLKDRSLLVERCYVGGEWIASASGSTIAVTDPATGREIARVPALTASETSSALAAAEAAGSEWADVPVSRRAALLEQWHGLILDNRDDLALIMTAEQGKPLAEALGEIGYAASFVKWFAEEARRGYGEIIPSPAGDRRIFALREPVGLSVAITPWNFPAAMITRKAAAALAAGCAMVVKPSELTPLSALALALLAERAGIPAGVLSVVTGMPDQIGPQFTGSDKVRKLSFTGSTRVGRLLMQECAPTLKRLSLELGGNAPFIVFDDADLDLAVAGLMASKFRNGGQTCVCANRVLVQRGVYAEFAGRLGAAVKKLKVGNGFAPDTTIGPLINAAAVGKVERHVVDALEKGAVQFAASECAPGGNFAAPLVLTDANPDMVLAREETFGPVAPLFSFGDEAEAVELANASESGLAGYFYSNDMRRIWRVAERLETGMVGANTGTISIEVAPFGGIKQSGFGREGARQGMEEYQSVKTLHLGL